MNDTADFTRTAAAMVARNDRRAWLRGLAAHARATGRRVLVAWSALALAGVVLVLLPLNMRVA